MSSFALPGLQYVNERPLDKGIVRNVSAQTMPPGAFYSIQNGIADTDGITRRPAIIDQFAAATIPYDILDAVLVNSTTGQIATLIITDTFLYNASSSGFNRVPWVYNTGTVSTSGSSVTGVGTDWLNGDIKAGDYFVDSASAEFLISSITDATHMAVTGTPAAMSGSVYSIYRTFLNVYPNKIDWAIHNNQLFLTGVGIRIGVYDPSAATLTDAITDTSWWPAGGRFYAEAITSFQDRIFVGHVSDSTDGDRYLRIRFSDVGVSASSYLNFSRATNYIDLDVPAAVGRIVRLIPFEDVMYVFCERGIILATLSSDALLPLSFRVLSTGGIGIISPRAVTGTLYHTFLTSYTPGNSYGAIFFVGQDNIYACDTAGNVIPIGTEVAKRTVDECKSPWRVMAAGDPQNHRVVFGFTKSADFIEEIWSFAYRAKAWSFDKLQTLMLANASITSSLTFAADSDLFSAATYTFASTAPSELFRSLLVERASHVSMYDATQLLDSGALPIEFQLETRDIDLDMPGVIKTYYSLSVKISEVFYHDVPIQFSLYGSSSRGRKWKLLGTLVIKVGFDEGRSSFRITGSTGRFRLTSTSQVLPFTVTELGLEVVQIGPEDRLETGAG